jgi:hypothetical protein
VTESDPPTPALLIVIPTRNRAGLCVAAIGSISDLADRVAIVVSDNSTEADDRARLAQFCAGLGRRVTLVAPPEPMSMSDHWRWAIAEALSSHPSATHLLILTDRMVFKAGELEALLLIVTREPGALISFAHDTIDDHQKPVRLFLNDWSGRLVRISSRSLIRGAQMSEPNMALPRLLNSVVPLTMLDQIRDRFGDVVGSQAPDFWFAFRAVAVVDSILFYDRAPIIDYAVARSNGNSYARGLPSPDGQDFLKQAKSAGVNWAAPIPGFHVIANSIAHEYCQVQTEVGAEVFPPLDMPRYFTRIDREVQRLENPRLKRDMQDLLAGAGYSRGMKQRAWQLLDRPSRLAVAHGPNFFAFALRRARRLGLARALALPGIGGLLAAVLGPRRAEARWVPFESSELAIGFAEAHPCRPDRALSHLVPVLSPTEMRAAKSARR